MKSIGSIFEQQQRFVADAAHELRSPVMALSLHARNLDPVIAREGADRLAALKSSIRRTGHLLEQLLAFARNESTGVLQAQHTSFDDVVKEVVASFLPHARANSIDLGCERIQRIEILAYATSLNVMVRNLVDNALRYTPTGGRVDVDLSRDGDRAVFRIEDTGPGVAQAELARVFEPFYRGRHVTVEGSGLGLSIVRRIVENLSGTITLENVSAHHRTGLRVLVSLPLAGG